VNLGKVGQKEKLKAIPPNRTRKKTKEKKKRELMKEKALGGGRNEHLIA